jgi:hypothetical protein
MKSAKAARRPAPLPGGWTRSALKAWLKAELRRRYGTPQRVDVQDTLAGDERRECRNASKLRHMDQAWGGEFTSWEDALDRVMPGDAIELCIYDWDHDARRTHPADRDPEWDVELVDQITVEIPRAKP